ncbi:cytochrome P450 9e2-like [Zophobas morio]|uniref:cytochrome P450 9e2-like n=1 Tax=Zophobas morio TaxID=2755281 RepID=UPI003083ABD5
MWWWIVAAVASAAATLWYWLMICPQKYWLERGVKPRTSGFLLGDNLGIFLGRQSLVEMVEVVYKSCPNTRYVGTYQFFRPSLLVKDPDLIKQITVKDFDHFLDHRSLIPEDSEPLWSKNLFALTGKAWRDMRSTLSPAFTSSKMKHIFTLISQNGEQFVNHFLKKDEKLITVEMRDIFTRFTNDIIASAAFGIECDSLSNRNNEFYLMGKETTNFSGFRKIFSFFLIMLIPKVAKLLKMTMFSQEVNNFFTTIVKSSIRSREQLGIVRPDMIHLLLEARKNGLKHEETQPAQDTGFATVQESEIHKDPKNAKAEITDQDMTSQALIFFFAGFESVSAVMCFMAHELAVNPEVQERLIREIDETLEGCKSGVTYEALLGMKYMDMVVSETMRKWPNPVVDRICTKAYTIEPKLPHEKPVHLKVNDAVWIPVFGIHRDPEYYPEPDKFDPERFNDENKVNINPYTYMPFGAGPRNCIGSRFALLEIKALFFYVLSHFEIVPVEKTQIPLVLSKKKLNMTAENGFWLGLKRRSKV